MHREATRWLVGVLAAAAVSACESRAPGAINTPAALDTVAIRASIDTLTANIKRAHETQDAELFAASWAVDGIMSPPGVPPIIGRDSIVADFRRRRPLPPGATMTITPHEIRVLSADWAYVLGISSLTMMPPAVSAPVHHSWTVLVLLRKGAEGWQTYREVLSPHQPT